MFWPIKTRDGQLITKQFINKNRTASGGWTREFFERCGLPFPPPHGWKRNYIQRNPNRWEQQMLNDGKIVTTRPLISCEKCRAKTDSPIFRYGVRLCLACFEKIEGPELAAFHQKASATL